MARGSKAPSRENPPGFNFDHTEWKRLTGELGELLDRASFSPGEIIRPRHKDADEIFFIRSGVVAVDLRRPGAIDRRMLLTRGAKFRPAFSTDAASYSALTR